MKPRHHIQFPQADLQSLQQDEVFFYLTENGSKTKVRFHDYDEIFKRPGLYEQLFYDRLKCTSPTRVGELLERSLTTDRESLSELRVLDLGAGNGMMGEVLKHRYGVARLIGVDIIPEAKTATFRDRPDVYDEYYVVDFTGLDDEQKSDLSEWSCDCLTSVAALGFGDIPPEAFFTALQLIQPSGWVAVNIKETFLDHDDNSGFSRFIRELMFSEYFNVYHLERYRHRLSMEGIQLFYYALVGRKTKAIPEDYLEEILSSEPSALV